MDNELFVDESKVEKKDIVAKNDSIPAPTGEMRNDNEFNQLGTSLKAIEEAANALQKYDSTDSTKKRNMLMQSLFQEFAIRRFNTNRRVETLKDKLLERVENNIQNLDLETALQAIKDLHDMTTTDLDRALGINNQSPVQINLQNNLSNEDKSTHVSVAPESLSAINKINEAVDLIKKTGPIVDVEAEVVDDSQNSNR